MEKSSKANESLSNMRKDENKTEEKEAVHDPDQDPVEEGEETALLTGEGGTLTERLWGSEVLKRTTLVTIAGRPDTGQTNAESLRKAEESTSRKTASATSAEKRGTSKGIARKEGQRQGQGLLPKVSLEADPKARDRKMERKDQERDQNRADPEVQSQAPDLLPKKRRVRKGKTEVRKEINILLLWIYWELIYFSNEETQLHTYINGVF